ncbi:helix-turn-helix domain-containing protein [uncultured Oscillibacter sp.]|uniref:helix-turn-helix domain-containing protein n=1 Tax=uncultured Oscillibacter sp. TaxID=876091 RepID=UPI00261EEA20|nr:helix-turn-helix domain-containing protein [uncultured Oscillibacter sp.]
MDKDETPELTYALIQRAVHGDKAALEMILRHFDAYINAVSTVEKTLPSGETIEEVDEDIKIQIQTHLVEVIQKKWRELI